MGKTYKIILITLLVTLSACSKQISKTYTISNNIQPPRNLEAVLFAPTQVVLVWADYSNNETAFIIERSEDKNNFYMLKKMPNNSVTYLDKDLKSNKKYYYRVKAVGGTAQSHYSNIAETQTVER